jgi:FemAB-related protein (PEP-CTERM system-associated)
MTHVYSAIESRTQNLINVGNQIDSTKWNAFVRAHPLGTPFHLMNWQSTIQNTFGHQPQHIVAQNEHGAVIGVLPLFLVRSRLFGRMLVSTPQAAYGGILANSESVAQAIFRRAYDLAKESTVQFLELRNFQQPIDHESLAVKDLYVTFRKELHPDPEVTLLAIPRKTRAEVREGIRHGLEFKVDEVGVNEFFDVYSRSVRDLGTPVFSKTLFLNGCREFGSDCRIISVHWQGKLVSSVWTLFYKDEVIPYFGGSIREYNRLAVNNFMYGMLMRYGCENGYRIFDFGRSKKGTGSFDFKKRWGMTMSDLPYQYALICQQAMPDTSPMNPKYAMGIRLWRKLPLRITQWVGPVVSRHLI